MFIWDPVFLSSLEENKKKMDQKIMDDKVYGNGLKEKL